MQITVSLFVEIPASNDINQIEAVVQEGIRKAIVIAWG